MGLEEIAALCEGSVFDLSLAGKLHNQSKYSDEMQIPNYHFIKSGMPQESREPVSELFAVLETGSATEVLG